MAGTVSVWIEGEADTLVEQRISKVARVYIRQVSGDTESSSHVSEQKIVDSWLTDLHNFTTIGDFPTIIPRKKLVSELLTFEFPFGPKKVTYGGNALAYTEIRRPGMKPLLRAMNPQNRTISLNCVIVDRTTHGIGSVETQLNTLKDIATADRDIEFQHGVVTFPSRLRATGMQIESVERNLQGEITKARVSMNFKESIPLNVDLIWLKAVTEEPKPLAVIPDEDDKDRIGSTGLECTDEVLAHSGLTGPSATFNATTALLHGIL